MVKEYEVRVGNKIKFINKVVAVHAETIEDIKKCNDADSPFKYEPIEITPEILEKAGFVKVNERTYAKETVNFIKYELTWNKISNDIHSIGIEVLNEDGQREGLQNFCWNVKYLHRLQNIFYALTGKELEINNL